MQTQTKTPRPPLNGVDTPGLLGTINVVAGQPELANFTFRASTEWIEGTHSRSTFQGFFGAGEEHQHGQPHIGESDHPAVLTGADNAPLPVEWVLHALATCLMSGIANISAARGVKLTKVTSHIEGDMDSRGILGLSDEVRNGFSSIRIEFEIKGDAPAEKLRQIVEQSRARSAVYDILTNGLPVAVDVKTLQ
jgi:uncharacterized OsmC-like protein